METRASLAYPGKSVVGIALEALGRMMFEIRISSVGSISRLRFADSVTSTSHSSLAARESKVLAIHSIKHGVYNHPNPGHPEPTTRRFQLSSKHLHKRLTAIFVDPRNLHIGAFCDLSDSHVSFCGPFGVCNSNRDSLTQMKRLSPLCFRHTPNASVQSRTERVRASR